MSLRDVEEATDKKISNAYLSQLENGKIIQPSPRILHALSQALKIDYEVLMKRAGYLLPTTKTTTRGEHVRAPKFSIDNLTAGEESQLLEYLTFLRTKKK